MTDFLTDNFTDADATTLQSHTSDSGASWTRHGSFSATDLTINTNRLIGNASGAPGYYASQVASTNVYDITGSVFIKSIANPGDNGKYLIIGGRYNTGARTGYEVSFSISGGTIIVELAKYNAGAFTSLGTYTITSPTASTSFTFKLEIKSATKKVFIDGTERISNANDDLTSTGNVMVRNNAASSTAGLHLDSIVGHEPSNDLIATLPMRTFSANVATGVVGQIAATLPMMTLVMGKSRLAATLPMMTMTAQAAIGVVGQLSATLPMMTLAAQGNDDALAGTFPLLRSTMSGYMAVFKAEFPLLEANLIGLHGVIGTIAAEFPHLTATLVGGMDRIAASFPSLTATITGTSGVVGSIEASFPLLTSAFTGAAQNTGVIAATFPLLRSSISGRQTVVGTITAEFPVLKSTLSGVMGIAGSIAATLPLLTSQIIGSPRVTGTIDATFALLTCELIAAPSERPIAKVIALNVRNAALTEYEAFSFNSFAQFNGVQLAANTSGIHALGGDTDGASAIQARIRSGQNDLRKASAGAADRLKRPVDAYVSYQSLADARFSILVEDTQYDYHLPSTSPVMKTQKVDLGRGLKTRYVQWQMENLDGQALELDQVTLNVDVLKRRV